MSICANWRNMSVTQHTKLCAAKLGCIMPPAKTNCACKEQKTYFTLCHSKVIHDGYIVYSNTLSLAAGCQQSVPVGATGKKVEISLFQMTMDFTVCKIDWILYECRLIMQAFVYAFLVLWIVHTMKNVSMLYTDTHMMHTCIHTVVLIVHYYDWEATLQTQTQTQYDNV